MSSNDRWEAIPLIAQTCGHRPLNIIQISFCLLLVLGMAAGCSVRKVRPYTSKEAVAKLSENAAEIKTGRGRAWVSVKSKEKKLSFPALVAIDRSAPSSPLLRIEAMDPLGITHGLMLLGNDGRFHWIDFDQRHVAAAAGRSWHGLPLKHLPELLLGLAVFPDEGSVGSVENDGFEVRTPKARFHYELTWIDPGPRLALAGVTGEVQTGKADTPPETYRVQYSKFMDKPDYYLPQEVQLNGSSHEDSIEIHISWRERRWNEKIPPEIFRMPAAAIKGFSKGKID